MSIAVGTGEVSAQCPRAQAICRHQTNGDIRGDYLQFYGVVEHDFGADGGGERMRGEGISANRFGKELFEQCHILFHQSRHRMYYFWNDLHYRRMLSNDQPRGVSMDFNFAVLVPGFGDFVHIFAVGSI